MCDWSICEADIPSSYIQSPLSKVSEHCDDATGWERSDGTFGGKLDAMCRALLLWQKTCELVCLFAFWSCILGWPRDLLLHRIWLRMPSDFCMPRFARLNSFFDDFHAGEWSSATRSQWHSIARRQYFLSWLPGLCQTWEEPVQHNFCVFTWYIVIYFIQANWQELKYNLVMDPPWWWCQGFRWGKCLCSFGRLQTILESTIGSRIYLVL